MKGKIRIAHSVKIIMLAILILTACASGGVGPVLPSPTNVVIIPPASDLAPSLAAFSGIWEGVWDGQLSSRLIVERIDATSAQVVYIWGRSLNNYVNPGWRRYKVHVLPDGKLQWGKDFSYTFTMNENLVNIRGELKQPSHVFTIIMEKVSSK